MTDCSRCQDTGTIFGPILPNGRNEWARACTCKQKEKKMSWTLCTNKLPNDTDRVLVKLTDKFYEQDVSQKGQIIIATYEKDGWVDDNGNWEDDDTVEKWMPLPEA